MNKEHVKSDVKISLHTTQYIVEILHFFWKLREITANNVTFLCISIIYTFYLNNLTFGPQFHHVSSSLHCFLYWAGE